jgi:hypothetical protein
MAAVLLEGVRNEANERLCRAINTSYCQPNLALSLTYILADIYHVCDANKMNVEHLLRNASYIFRKEVEEST